MRECKSCQYFLPVPAERDAESGKLVGRCKRRSPQLTAVASKTIPEEEIKFRENGQMMKGVNGFTTHYLNGTGWPTVREDEWCGEFEHVAEFMQA